jgi:Asp-tRNA(Asn)/Glu-tRNA(Gln) amidotransferase A subunit family amidase
LIKGGRVSGGSRYVFCVPRPSPPYRDHTITKELKIMISHLLVNNLHVDAPTIHEFIAQAEARFDEKEPSIQAFVLEKDRFTRLYDDAVALHLGYPDPARRPPLFGALAGIKDNFHVDGFTTQAASRLPVKVLQGEEAESVKRLKEAGALIFGKTVTTELAYFSPIPTRNPHSLEHTPGGSSSGSAAAVAAGFCHVALGTQTIGSVIRPASFCGVVGFKPTYDRISRAGIIPLSPSLDHVGIFTPEVSAAKQVASVLIKDWKAETTQRRPTLGIPEGTYLASASDYALARFDVICKLLSKAGYKLRRVRVMEDFQEVHDRHHVILSAEAARVHRDWFDKYGDLYSAKFTELIQRGQTISDDRLQSALSARDDFRAEMRRTFLDHDIDFWICPSAVDVAPKSPEGTGDPVMNLPWTQAGLPAINLPAGKNQMGLPLGLQVVGNWYKDESLLFWARDWERALADL